ncbi:MAG: HD domain-containing protein, partial [Chloroflexi bacterium]|nr:HD domain-containing protein [Chloroflexota bacterium]
MSDYYLTRKDAEALEGLLSPHALRSTDDVAASRVKELGGKATKGSDRTHFERDRDRILHSRQFRRLAGKTQIMVAPASYERRTRLTHTVEVFQLASSMAGRFNLNLAAVEAIAFAHDLGHPPFGHPGERVLNVILLPLGGFHHAAQSVRVMESLAYDPVWIEEEKALGMNATRAVREGVLRHGWFKGRAFTRHHLPLTLKDGEANPECLTRDSAHGSLESQVVQVSDSIAYLNHDIDDLTAYGFDKILGPETVARFLERQASRGIKVDKELRTYFI